jgi:uncharacterized protein (TIGR00156 family)
MRIVIVVSLAFVSCGLNAQDVERQPMVSEQSATETQSSRSASSRLETAAATRVSTVKEVLASSKDDEDVVLRGRIVRHLKGENYIFSDGSAQIEIELDDDDYPRDRVLMNSDIEIRGEVDLDLNEKLSVEVDEMAEASTSAR